MADRSHHQFLSRFWRVAVLLIFFCSSTLLAIWEWPVQDIAQEIIWQPNNSSLNPEGVWNKIGVNTLVVQWTVTNGKAWYPTSDFPEWNRQPDWKHFIGKAWSRKIILGLSGDFQVHLSRKNSALLSTDSWKIYARPPIVPDAWYAPVEISPGWKNIHQIRAYLNSLPRPLWVSIYGTQKLHRASLVRWVRSWLPLGVGIYYQDGVGEGWASPSEAKKQVNTLRYYFGNRVRVIVEDYHISKNGTIKPASIWSIWNQLRIFHGYTIAIFSVKQFSVVQAFEIKALSLFFGT